MGKDFCGLPPNLGCFHVSSCFLLPGTWGTFQALGLLSLCCPPSLWSVAAAGFEKWVPLGEVEFLGYRGKAGQCGSFIMMQHEGVSLRGPISVRLAMEQGQACLPQGQDEGHGPECLLHNQAQPSPASG